MSETHQGCSRETCPVRVPGHSNQSHDPGETRGGPPPCARPHTDFSLPHRGGSSIPHLCSCWGQLLQFINVPPGHSEPGDGRGDALVSSLDSSALTSSGNTYCFKDFFVWEHFCVSVSYKMILTVSDFCLSQKVCCIYLSRLYNMMVPFD